MFDNRMMILGSVESLDEIHSKQKGLTSDIKGLIEGIEFYIKRTLYTSEKKKELEASKDKVEELRNYQEKIRFSLSMFDKINENLGKQQYQTAVLLYRFLEDRKVCEEVGVEDFTKVYKSFQKSVIERLVWGVDNMLETWLNYCSGRQKELCERIYSKIDSTLRQMYTMSSSSAKDKKARMTQNIRMTYMNGSITQRENQNRNTTTRPSEAYQRTTVALDLEKMGDEPSGIGINTKIDLHILKNVIVHYG